MALSKLDAAGGDIVTGRVAFCLSYNGFGYHGWQAQKSGLPTIQKYLQQAVSRVANQPIDLVCAGRTDRAVHAGFQVVHFDTTAQRTMRSWVFGCNANLPKDISVTWAGNVCRDFHARFSATSRRYHYLIYNHPVRPSSFSDQLTWCHYPLDERLMNEAAQCLVGEHDFSAFRAVGCQSRSPNRYLEFVRVKRFSNIIMIDIKGNAFLHHMVRNIAGVLMAIGSGKQSVDWCNIVLQSRDRTQADVTAPPGGLYLTHVEYPEHFGIPVSSGAPSLIQAMLTEAGHSARTDAHNLWQISRLD